jgi:microfibrillar-associated protein 1
MTSGADPYSILSKDPERAIWKKPVPKPKVNMYRSGKEPKLQGQNEDESSDSNIFSDGEDNKTLISKFSHGNKLSVATEDKAALKSQILKQNFALPARSHEGSNLEGKKVKETSIQNQEISTKAVPVERKLVTEEVEVVTRRRRGVASAVEREENRPLEEGNLGKRVVRETSEVEKKPEVGVGVDQNEEDASGEEDDESEELGMGQAAVKTQITRPVFIKQDYRNHITLEDAMALEREQEQERLKKSMEQQNKMLVIEAKKARDDQDDDNLSDSERDLPNDSTDDEKVEYEKWKERELKRLHRDREEREKAFKEKEAIERRRQMTDEERAQDDKRIGKYKQVQKSHYRFMQKHYTMGIFNRDDDDPLFKRDYNMAVGEDLFDKSTLPAILQQRRGEEHRKGKSKYTHLVAEDTTNFDPEYLPFESIHLKQKGMTAGYKNSNVFDRPSHKKK